MVDRPDPVCVPLEIERIPLYRDGAGAARLRREQRRQQRREKGGVGSRSKRMLARLVGADPGTRREGSVP